MSRWKIGVIIVAGLLALIGLYIGTCVRNQRYLFEGFQRAEAAFSDERWNETHDEINMLQKKRAFGKVACIIFLGEINYEKFFGLIGKSNWFTPHYKIAMLDRECLYRAAHKAYVSQEWEKGIQCFLNMDEIERRDILETPYKPIYDREDISGQQLSNEEIYQKVVRAYQQERGLKDYFCDPALLHQDCYYQLGLIKMKEHAWKAALSYFSNLPFDEEYDALRARCME